MIDFALSHYTVYFLVLLRVVAFIGVSPIVSLKDWPVWAKIGLGVFVSLVVTPTVHTTVPDPFAMPGQYIIAALLESMTGMILGFIATLVFSAITIAGQMIDVQIGFSSAQLFDPGTSQMTGLTGTFHNILFTLYFLGLNGLDGLLLVTMDSYKFIGIGQFHLPAGSWQALVHLTGLVMAFAVELAAPIMVALLLTDITFAFLSRAVPQMNVYVVGLPAKLLVGLSLYVVVIPAIIYLFNQLFDMLFLQMNSLLQFLGG